MSRIRSVHPGLFTDEAFMAASMSARMLLIGIWTECDDQGVFEWKPLTLKARILPADNVDVEALLTELVRGKFVTRFDLTDHSYGAVRNFRRFQRPKKPNAVHLLPPEFRSYVGLNDDSGEPVPYQFPTSGEKPPQMEDGGCRREDEGRVRAGSRSQPHPEPEEPSKTAQAPFSGLAFEGKVIRLKPKDLEAWRKTYHGIPDLTAELCTLDAYYDAELAGNERKRWFVRCSAALDKKHQAATAARQASTGDGWGAPGFA